MNRTRRVVFAPYCSPLVLALTPEPCGSCYGFPSAPPYSFLHLEYSLNRARVVGAERSHIVSRISKHVQHLRLDTLRHCNSELLGHCEKYKIAEPTADRKAWELVDTYTMHWTITHLYRKAGSLCLPCVMNNERCICQKDHKVLFRFLSSLESKHGRGFLPF